MFFPLPGVLSGPPIIDDGDTRLPERAAVGAVPDEVDDDVGEGPALDFGSADELCGV